MMTKRDKEILQRFADEIKRTDPQKRERLVTFCEGAAYALMTQRREEKTA